VTRLRRDTSRHHNKYRPPRNPDRPSSMSAIGHSIVFQRASIRMCEVDSENCRHLDIMFALLRKAVQHDHDVRFVPKGDMARRSTYLS